MGILGKLMFWKKKDEFEDIGLGERGNIPSMDLGLGPEIGAGTEFGQDYGRYPSSGRQFGSQPSFQQASPQQSSFQPSFGPPSYSQPQMQSSDYTTSKNLEVISSKLDALRAAIDSINQRLANLEAIARGEEEQRYRRRW